MLPGLVPLLPLIAAEPSPALPASRKAFGGVTVRRALAVAALGAGAWLAMLAAGQAHASAAPAHVIPAPAHAAPADPTAASSRVASGLRDLTGATTHTVSLAGTHATKTIARTTTPLAKVVTAATKLATDRVARSAAPVTARAGQVVAPVTKIAAHAAAPVTTRLHALAAPVTTAVGRTVTPVLSPLLSTVTPIVTTVAPVIAPIVNPLAPVVAPVIAPIAPVLATPSPILVVRLPGTAGRTARHELGTNAAAVRTTSAAVLTAVPRRLLAHSSVLPAAPTGRAGASAPFLLPLRDAATPGGGRPAGPGPVPTAALPGAAGAGGPGPSHDHGSANALAGRIARLGGPGSVRIARPDSDRLPGAPVRSTDVSPD